MRVEPQGLEAYLGGMNAEKGGDLAVVHALASVVDVVGANGSVWWRLITAEMQVAVGSENNWITEGVTSCFDGGEFFPDEILLDVKE